jgi:hypothetical protein
MSDRWKNGLLIAAAIVLIVGLAAGGYFLGKSSGEDLDAARAQGAAVGQRAGAAQGASEGFAQGRKEARGKAFATSYTTSYRASYRQAYEDAGLDPPDQIDVPKPTP